MSPERTGTPDVAKKNVQSVCLESVLFELLRIERSLEVEKPIKARLQVLYRNAGDEIREIGIFHDLSTVYNCATTSACMQVFKR